MALIRFQDLDPVRHLLALQQELDRFQRNPGVSLGPSGMAPFLRSIFLRTRRAWRLPSYPESRRKR
jgi:hypothetical protein